MLIANSMNFSNLLESFDSIIENLEEFKINK